MPQACAGHVLPWFMFGGTELGHFWIRWSLYLTTGSCQSQKMPVNVSFKQFSVCCIIQQLCVLIWDFTCCNLRGTWEKHHPLLFWCLNVLDELKLLLEFTSHWTKLDIYNIIVVFFALLCSVLSAEIVNYVDGRNEHPFLLAGLFSETVRNDKK